MAKILGAIVGICFAVGMLILAVYQHDRYVPPKIEIRAGPTLTIEEISALVGPIPGVTSLVIDDDVFIADSILCNASERVMWLQIAGYEFDSETITVTVDTHGHSFEYIAPDKIVIRR